MARIASSRSAGAALPEIAASDRLPVWAQAGAERRAHIARVVALLEEWASALGLPADERARWAAAGWLHDALRDAPAEELRAAVHNADFADLPGKLLHGPAAAERLRAEGVQDEELLHAISYHTLGSAQFGALGRALYSADFLEPGRALLPEWRAALRARMPHDLDDVTRAIARARIEHLLSEDAQVHPRTLGFWNSLARPRRARAH